MMKLDELLLAWFDANARALPWRGERDVYRIWLSEIMLQQTRAQTVCGYYLRFLEAFPDVHTLAAAEEDSVLKLWEGLGYYSRARNLHAAAKRVSAQGGHFPSTVQGLMELPGIGPYAARAIASIAYGIAVPAPDGNHMRVLSRLHAVERTLKSPFDPELLKLESISHARPGDYNQALMDLGARICTPRKPKCASCPLCSICLAHEAGDEERYPLRAAPTVKREEARSVLLIEVNGRICVQRRDSTRLLSGLFEFPGIEGHPPKEEILSTLEHMGYQKPRAISALPNARHVFTHLIWRMKGYKLSASSCPRGVITVDAEGLDALAMPGALRIYRALAREIAHKCKD